MADFINPDAERREPGLAPRQRPLNRKRMRRCIWIQPCFWAATLTWAAISSAVAWPDLRSSRTPTPPRTPSSRRRRSGRSDCSRGGHRKRDDHTRRLVTARCHLAATELAQTVGRHLVAFDHRPQVGSAGAEALRLRRRACGPLRCPSPSAAWWRRPLWRRAPRAKRHGAERRSDFTACLEGSSCGRRQPRHNGASSQTWRAPRQGRDRCHPLAPKGPSVAKFRMTVSLLRRTGRVQAPTLGRSWLRHILPFAG